MNRERRSGWNALAAAVALLLGSLPPGATGAEPPAGAAAQGVLEVLAQNRARGVPNYVTVDVLLVAREDIAAREQQAIERETLAALRRWIAALAVSPAGSAHAPPADAESRVNDLASLLAVIAGERKADDLSPRAAAEYALISRAAAIEVSPLWSVRVDYSQLAPRGYYAADAELSRYFVLARYLGAVLFPVRASEATGVTDATVRDAMDALREIARRVPDQEAYAALLRPACASGGKQDDLSLEDVRALSSVQDPLALASALYDRAVKSDRRPRVLSGYVDRSRLRENETAADVLTGVRLLPGVATWDAIVFQRLVNEAGAFTGKPAALPFSASRGGEGIVKGYPRADELLAVLGSKAALERLARSGDTLYANYDELMVDLQRGVAGEQRPADAAVLAALAASPGGEQDETARAAWTLARHRQLLHAKQSYTLVSRAMRLDAREQAAIEPAAAAFAAIAADAKARADAATAGMQESWQGLAALADLCGSLAAAVAEGKPPGEDDVAFLNNIDQAIDALGVARDRAVVADVHTNPGDREVLQEATALPRRVEKPCGNTTCMGAKLSHREFKQPMEHRLSDEEWRAQLGKERPVSPAPADALAPRAGVLP